MQEPLPPGCHPHAFVTPPSRRPDGRRLAVLGAAPGRRRSGRRDAGVTSAPPMPDVVESDRFADAAVRQRVEPDPAAEGGLADAVVVLADADPAVRLDARAD